MKFICLSALLFAAATTATLRSTILQQVTAHTKIVCTQAEFAANGDFTRCSGAINRRDAFTRIRQEENPAQTNPRIQAGTMPPVASMAQVCRGGELDLMWPENTHPGSRGGTAVFLDPRRTVIRTGNEPMPRWNEWSIDNSPGRHPWPKNLMAAFNYKSDVKYEPGYFFQTTTPVNTKCEIWRSDDGSAVSKLCGGGARSNAACGGPTRGKKGNMCHNKALVPLDLPLGVQRARLHMYNFENESHWNSVFYFNVKDCVGKQTQSHVWDKFTTFIPTDAQAKAAKAKGRSGQESRIAAVNCTLTDGNVYASTDLAQTVQIQQGKAELIDLEQFILTGKTIQFVDQSMIDDCF